VEPQATQFDLTLKITRDDEGWSAIWYYRADLFEAESAACIADCFETLLGAIAEQPDRAVRHLPLSKAEGAALAPSNAGGEGGQPQTLAALFDAQASATPWATAVRDDAGVLSYAELRRASDALAVRLLDAGVRIEDPVAIILPRCRDAVIALLAVAKAGGAFLCLDPSLPAERKAWIARNARIRIQLTNAATADAFIPEIAPVLRVDAPAEEPEPTPRPLPRVSPDQLAYIIYTSGSTGRPKGVLLSSRGLAQLQALHRGRFGTRPGDQILQYSPCSFDAFVWEHVMALLTGACLHLTDAERLQPGPPLAATISERGITHVTMPPSNAAMLGTLPPTIKQLILAGEPCPPEAVTRWAGRTVLWNAYGPTEATVCATIKSCNGLEPGTAPSIGTAFEDAQAFVLDEGMNPVPPLVPGELFLGGPGLARGYLGQAALTASSFVPHPFPAIPGERLYRTGDLARLTVAGEIEFLGRRDGQVKLRGIRVELGEIENALASLDPGIAGAVALVAGSGEDRHLVAFVAGRPELDGAALRERLSAHLPNYMIPAWVERIDAFPLTANGKLDRAALAARAAGRHRQAGHKAPPRGTVEQEVASIWGQLLTDVEIGRDDSFFSIGGTSLTLTRLHERLEARFPGRLRIVDLFRLNTVAAIAGALAAGPRATEAAPRPAAKMSIHL
jgi:amino acid adenylation domain-containing protein